MAGLQGEHLGLLVTREKHKGNLPLAVLVEQRVGRCLHRAELLREGGNEGAGNLDGDVLLGMLARPIFQGEGKEPGHAPPVAGDDAVVAVLPGRGSENWLPVVQATLVDMQSQRVHPFRVDLCAHLGRMAFQMLNLDSCGHGLCSSSQVRLFRGC